MSLRPLNDAIIIDPDPEEFASGDDPEIDRIVAEGVIKIPEKYMGYFKKSPMRGTVISCGDKCRYDWKTGDRIVFGRFCGAPFPFKDKKYRVIREYEALAREEE